jgi:hypothetical protein
VKNDKRYEISQLLIRRRMVKICEEKYPGMHPSDVVNYLRLGECMTEVEAAHHLRVGLSTLRSWQRPEAGGQIITDKLRQLRRNNARRLNEQKRNR